MRIISGSLGGRKIHPPAKMPYTRPTTDIAKEGLFNILQTRIDFEGIKTLDLFGGTGSISYELASRGAAQLTIVENDATMQQFIKKNIAKAFDFGKIALAPIIYNYEYKNTLKEYQHYHSIRSVIENNSFNFNGSFLDIKQENFESLFNKLIDINEISCKEILKFNLDIRKDDILDILNSV